MDVSRGYRIGLQVCPPGDIAMTSSSRLLASWFLLKIQVFLRATNYSIYVIKATLTWMPIDRWMGKEAVVHTHDGILLSRKDEHIGVGSNEVDEPRACYTEWSKPEGGKPLSYINACTWSPERWCWWTPSQGSSGDADVEGRLVGPEDDARAGRMDGAAWRRAHRRVWDRRRASAVWRRGSRPVLWDDLEGWDGGGGREGTHAYLWPVHVAARQRPAQSCRAVVPQLKINTFLKSYLKKGNISAHKEETMKEKNKMHVFSKIRYEKWQ